MQEIAVLGIIAEVMAIMQNEMVNVSGRNQEFWIGQLATWIILMLLRNDFCATDDVRIHNYTQLWTIRNFNVAATAIDINWPSFWRCKAIDSISRILYSLSTQISNAKRSQIYCACSKNYAPNFELKQQAKRIFRLWNSQNLFERTCWCSKSNALIIQYGGVPWLKSHCVITR